MGSHYIGCPFFLLPFPGTLVPPFRPSSLVLRSLSQVTRQAPWYQGRSHYGPRPLALPLVMVGRPRQAGRLGWAPPERRG